MKYKNRFFARIIVTILAVAISFTGESTLLTRAGDDDVRTVAATGTDADPQVETVVGQTEFPTGLAPAQEGYADFSDISAPSKSSTTSSLRLQGSSARLLAGRDWSSYSGNYCYNNFTDAEKALYDALKQTSDRLINGTMDCTQTAVSMGSETVYVYLYEDGLCAYEGMTSDQANLIAWYFYYNNPQYYFYKNTVISGTLGDGSTVVTIGVYDEFASGTDRAAATTAVAARMDAIEAQLDPLVANCTDDLAKETVIHDYELERLDYKAGTLDQSVYTALIPDATTGKYYTVCAGYSKFFAMYANHYGLSAVIVTGTGRGENHAWNRVNISGNWYNVDTTWDDPNSYTYFNKSDSTFLTSRHVPGPDSSGDSIGDYHEWLPTCLSDSVGCGNCGSNRAPTVSRIEATCVSDGSVTYTCEECGQSTVVPIAAKGHASDGGKVTKAQTCTEDGVRTYTCTREGCGEVLRTETISAPGHSWNSGVVTRVATTTSTGVKTYTCTVCKATKTEPIPKVTVPAASVSYITHIQNIGWESAYRVDGAVSGTSGRSLRLEGIRIKAAGNSNLGVQYTTHCQDYGWLAWSANGEMNGTEGESKRLEAIMINLTGADKDLYDIYYRVHAQNIGWMNWAKNGAPAGTAGYGYRLEAIQIQVVQRGASYDAAKGGIKSVSADAYRDKNHGGTPVVLNSSIPNLSYRTHVQNVGWQAWKTNGAFSGTSGRSLRLEGINIKLTNKDYTGGIRYKTHIQNIGWENQWRTDGTMSGTSGRSLRLEAIDVELYGEIASYYDIYYRVHAQDVGWMGWAKNGAHAGTAGYGRRLEGIQIVLVKKGAAAPAATVNGITSVTAKPYLSR